MHGFVRNLITEWRRLELPFSASAIVVAVSGGTDSNSLLLALHDLTTRKKLGHRIVAAHFNHRLRGVESDADEEYVRQLTIKLGIEFAVGHAKLDKGGNVEQNAREARYQFLTRTAKSVGAFAVLTAHTINDQAETFLINLIRGSGPDGLSGMRPVRFMEEEKRGRGEEAMGQSGVAHGHEPRNEARELEDKEISVPPLLPFSSSPLLLVRPLLRWAKRRNTEGFCHDLGVECCHDAMNDDTAFRRVRIRKVLLPLLEDFNPKIVDTLAQTAELMRDLSNTSETGNHSAVTDELILGEVK